MNKFPSLRNCDLKKRFLPPIHVACCFDESMAMPAGVLAASIFENTLDAHVTLHMLHPPDLRTNISALIKRLNGDRFHIIEHVIGESFTNLYSTSQYTRSIYFRFLLPTIIKADRIIYLDADMIVRRSLRELFQTDLEGMPIAATEDHSLIFHMVNHNMPVLYGGTNMPVKQYCEEILQVDLSKTSYFNTGVLVMDLVAWRNENISEKCIRFCQINNGLVMPDQDAANNVLQGRFKHLDTRWNSFSYLMGEYDPPPNPLRPEIFGGYERNFQSPTGKWREILEQWAYDPWIVHFVYLSKPWIASHRRTSFDREFWQFSKRTPYRRILRCRYLVGKLQIYWPLSRVFRLRMLNYSYRLGIFFHLNKLKPRRKLLIVKDFIKKISRVINR